MKIYKDNIKLFEVRLLKISKLLNRISLLRLFIFIVSAIVLFYLISIKLLTAVFIFFPIALISFGAAINYHNKTAFLKKHTAFLKKINESEILREECHLEQFETGKKFMNSNHPYSSDLDIFGQHSLFQLLNRTTTESGAKCLAEWLTAPAPNNEIPERQKAVNELSKKTNLAAGFPGIGHALSKQKKRL